MPAPMPEPEAAATPRSPNPSRRRTGTAYRGSRRAAVWVWLALGAWVLSGCAEALALTDDCHARSFFWAPRYCADCVTSRELKTQLEAQRRALHRRLLAPGTAAAIHVTRDGRVVARTTFEGGHLELVGKPARSPERVLLSLRPLRSLAPAPCSARLFRDGAPIAVHELMRKTERELLLLVDVSSLRALAPGTRFVGEACGVRFALHDGARSALSEFEARFHELRVQQAASDRVADASGGARDE